MITRVLGTMMAGALLVCGTTAFAEAVISADFVTKPTTVGQPFSVMVSVTDTPSMNAISYYSIKVGYDGTRASLDSAVDQTGDTSGFDLAPAVMTSVGSTMKKSLPTDRYRVIQNLFSSNVNGAHNLVLLNFTLQSAGQFDLKLVDNNGSGLGDSDFANYPHTFSSTLPVAVSAFELD